MGLRPRPTRCRRVRAVAAYALSPPTRCRRLRAADTPLVDTYGARRLPPTGSTAGFALLCNPYMVYTINRKHG